MLSNPISVILPSPDSARCKPHLEWSISAREGKRAREEYDDGLLVIVEPSLARTWKSKASIDRLFWPVLVAINKDWGLFSTFSHSILTLR